MTSTMADDDDSGAGVDFDKITALMANFYGVSELDEEGGDNSANDPDNIDSSAFQVEDYVLRAVRDDELSDLLRTDETLITEVQELNNDMQNLVYENYNKFISATDTIRKMKDQVEGMETEIETLMKTMDSVGQRSSQINQNLQPKRERVENIQSLQRLIKRLEFLFELPLRLKRSIELEAYTQAVKYYNMASGILEKHSEVASFGAIQVESNEIMSTLKTSMYAHLSYNAKTKARVLSENIQLLIDLGENKKELAITFLTWHKQRLHQRLESLTHCFADGDPVEQEATGDTKDPYQPMWYANSIFLSDMNMFLESHDDLFGYSGSKTTGDDAEIDKDLSRGHHTMVREIFAEYFRIIRGHLLRHPLPLSLSRAAGNRRTPPHNNGYESSGSSDSNDSNGSNNSGSSNGSSTVSSNTNTEGFQILLTTLGRFKSELRESTVLLRPAKLRLGDRAAEIIENTIRTQMNRAFISLRTVFQSRIHGTLFGGSLKSFTGILFSIAF